MAKCDFTVRWVDLGCGSIGWSFSGRQDRIDLNPNGASVINNSLEGSEMILFLKNR